MKEKKRVLTAQELEIMKVIWQLGSATVRDVYEQLLKSRKIAYTTVMTMMGTLEQKGRLTKTLRDRAYVYTPTESALNTPVLAMCEMSVPTNVRCAPKSRDSLSLN